MPICHTKHGRAEQCDGIDGDERQAGTRAQFCAFAPPSNVGRAARPRMTSEPMRAETDVLVIGSGGAGMYAAIEAARAGCRVLLIDRSLIGRGGASGLAQMTAAAGIGAGRSCELT